LRVSRSIECRGPAIRKGEEGRGKQKGEVGRSGWRGRRGGGASSVEAVMPGQTHLKAGKAVTLTKTIIGTTFRGDS
jgi:hypothetical protein